MRGKKGEEIGQKGEWRGGAAGAGGKTHKFYKIDKTYKTYKIYRVGYGRSPRG